MKASERIYQIVETEIRNGNLLPGDPIDEERLMLQFDVSRTPVREALLQLKAQGLVVQLPRGGVVVAKLTLEQLYAMWELMAEMEGLCARYACERMTRGEVAELAEAHRKAAEVVARDDAIGWQEVNLAFHEVLYRGARNLYLRQEILRMRTRTQAYRNHAFGAYGRLQVSHDSHQLILDAITARDPDNAALQAREHLNPSASSPGFANLLRNLPHDLISEETKRNGDT